MVPLSIVVLISGNGSNLQAIIDAIDSGQLNARICAVISNKADAYGLQRAQQANIPSQILDHKDFSDRESFDQALMQCIDQYQPDLIVLAGFMRILSDGFVQHYLGKMLNIHPSLLPKYQGLNTHQRVLDADDKEHGVSIHFVTPELDGGPIILQAHIPVKTGDTADTLAQRIHEQEHIIYPLVIDWFAHHRVKMENHTVFFDNKPMTAEQKRYN